MNLMRNTTLNAVGAHRDLEQLLTDGDISKALTLLQNRDEDVDEAIREYNPETHVVMNRPNKFRKKSNPYISEKLPRTWQRYINNVELFFLLGKPMIWRKDAGDDDAYSMFVEFLKEHHFNSRIRQAKRNAGAETESALMYHIYRDEDGEQRVKSLVLSRLTGYKLRPFIDQYGDLRAFGYGYTLVEGNKRVQHWDFQTARTLFYCKRGRLGWEVQSYPNPTGKINVIYFKQSKAWDGAQTRIEREEMLDSRTADTNNYFGDPMAAASADVINNLADPEKPGKLIQLTGANSRFEYINPPNSPEMLRTEKASLRQSILFDTFTPDFDFESMKGMGTLSGVAIRNAMILGFIKRDNLRETYDELIKRHINLVIGILKFQHPEKAKQLDELVIGFEFAEPFDDDQAAKYASITQLYTAGLLSLQEAVEQLGICDHPDDEIKRIKDAEKEKMQMQQSMQMQQAVETQPSVDKQSVGKNKGED